MKNKKKNGVFSLPLLMYQAAALKKKEENTLNLGLKRKGLIQRIAGKKGLAGLAGVLGLLALLACELAGPAGLQACRFAGLLSFLFLCCLLPALSTSSRLPRELAFFSFLFFCFALVWFLFVSFQHYLPFSSCSFYVQIFICTLKHNIKFRLNKINIMHIK